MPIDRMHQPPAEQVRPEPVGDVAGELAVVPLADLFGELLDPAEGGDGTDVLLRSDFVQFPEDRFDQFLTAGETRAGFSFPFRKDRLEDRFPSAFSATSAGFLLSGWKRLTRPTKANSP
jgi:hypothetical protein